ncbi:MAG: FG-GAP-like repeat-containing protein [Thermoguttaceae bacterium]
MKTRLVLGLLGCCWLATRSAAQDWPRYGHDGALTGRCPIRGRITAPHVAWTYSVAGRELRLELEPAPGEHRVTLNAAVAADLGSPRFAPAGPPQLDIDGRGTLRPAVESFHERWAKILPGVTGYQRVGWNHAWTDQAVCRLQLFAYDRGFDRPRCVWQSDPPEAVIFNPLNVVFDIDGDGVPEICVAAHYRVMIFDGATGRKKTELRYHSCRPYGWFGLADVDGDGRMELVTIGDFQSHVDVLKYDPTQPEAERLSVKWRRDIETNIEERKKWPQIGPHPLADVNGDGRPELILNLFNDMGDGQWHTVVMDAGNGRTLWDLPRRFFHGSADVDGDRAAELFLTTTNGELVPGCGTIELVGFRGLKPAVRQSYQNAAWCLADVPCFGPTWSTTASQGMQHVLLRGKTRPVFFVKTWEADESRRVTLSAMHYRADRQIETLWKLENFPDGTEAVALDGNTDLPDAAAMVRVRLAANETLAVAGHNVRPRIVANQPLGAEVSMPIVAKLGAGQGRRVVVEGPGEQVFAIAPPRARGERPRLVWQRPGRGMRDGSRAVGLLAADLNGDGVCEVVAADRAREGHARLVAYRGDGTTLWEKAFPRTDGALPAWNRGALTFWWPGHFRQADAIDLFVNTRRGLMHSDVGHLLDGRNAKTLWTHDKAELPGAFRWGYAGIPLAVADLHANHLDELVCLYPVCYWTAEGRTGRITAGKELASRRELPAWAAYGEPMVYDFNGDGRPEVLLDSPYLLALLDVSGKPLWHGPGRIDFPVRSDEGNVGQTTACKHALVDIDGDGKFEIASAGYGDGVRLIDPRMGKVLWSLAAPAPTGPRVSAANIDGRGGDEIIYPAGNTLVAVTGDRVSGRLLWTWQAPAALSLPAIADVDGDGLAKIVVQDAAGTVYCLDTSPPR